MRYQTIVFFLFLLPFAGMTQSYQWQLYLNKTKLVSASVDSAVHIQLPVRENSVLQFDFPERDTSFTRSIIIMNEKRNTLLRKELEHSVKTISFSLSDILSKTNKQAFTVYIADIPSDPAKASSERIMPVPICYIKWKE